METPPTKGGQGRTVVIVLVVVIVILGGAFGYYYVTSSATISSLNKTVSSQSADLAAKAQVIEGLNSTVQSLNGQVATLNGVISADVAKMVALNATVLADTGKILNLEENLSKTQVQVVGLEGEVATLSGQISDLENIVALHVSQTVVTSRTVQVAALSCVDITTVSNSDAGYLSIAFNSTSSNLVFGASSQGGCTSPFNDNPTVFIFPSGTSGTYSIPMAPTGSGTYVFVGTGSSTPISVTVSIVEWT